jgi:hypothetical protein
VWGVVVFFKLVCRGWVGCARSTLMYSTVLVPLLLLHSCMECADHIHAVWLAATTSSLKIEEMTLESTPPKSSGRRMRLPINTSGKKTKNLVERIREGVSSSNGMITLTKTMSAFSRFLTCLQSSSCKIDYHTHTHTSSCWRR